MGANHRITHGFDDHRFHKVIADAFQMIPTPGAGYIIASDSQGNFVWTPAPSGGGAGGDQLWKVNTDHQLLQPSTPDPGSSTGGVLYPGIWLPGPTGTINVTPDTWLYGTADFRPLGTAAELGINSVGTVKIAASGQDILKTTLGGSVFLPPLDPSTIFDAERLVVGGGVQLGAANQTNEGTLQWTGTTFQGRMGGKWVDIPGIQGSTTGPNPPANPQPGDLWWRNTDGNLYVWYDDGNSKQWVPAMASVGKVTAQQFYLVSGAYAGGPTASLSLGFYVAALPFTLPGGLAGSQAVAKTAPTSTTNFDVRVNGTSKGSINWSGGVTTAAFTWAAAVSIAPGDRIELIAAATPDATLADITWTLRGAL